MAGKRNEIELASDRAKIAELMHRGTVKPTALMDAINAGRPKEKHVTRQTIANDIEALQKEYRESAMYDFNLAWHETLAQYQDLLKVTWQEFYSSKSVKVTVTADAQPDEADEFDEIMGGQGQMTAEALLSEAKTMKAIIKKEQREGNVAYLQLIEKIIEKIAKMKGVDGTSKIALTDSKGEDLPSITEGILSTLKRIAKPVDFDTIDADVVEQLEETDDTSSS